MHHEINPENILVIPVKVDFLLIKEGDAPLAEAKVDFSRIPYNDGKEDINAEYAYVSENFLSQPFQNNNLFLRPGLHLHWALPDAYTEGEMKENETGMHVTHTQVPDRWIINRKKEGNIEKSWVVESNYLHPEGKNNKYHAIAYPIEVKKVGQPFRYMGRSYCFYDAKITDASEQPTIPALPNEPKFLDGLTAVGYGEHTFAAFYPNCHSVFGFHDSEIKSDSDLDGIAYEVLGWYSKLERDPMGSLAISGALDFDGSSYIEIGSGVGIPIANETYTIEAFIKPTEHGINGIVGWGNYGTATEVNALRLGINKEIQNYWWGRASGYDLIASCSSTLADRKWHHIVASFDGTTRKIFLDGKELKKDEPKNHNVPSAANFRIGVTHIPFNEYFKGSIAEVRIWNVARTEEQIRECMHIQFEEPQAGLVAYYKFNDGIAGGDNTGKIILADSSGNGNHGTLKNFQLQGDASNWVVGPLSNSLSSALKEQFNFSINNTDNVNFLPFSLMSLCYAKLTFNGQTTASSTPTVEGISIGNTATEALSAYLADKINPSSKMLIEEELEALQLLSKVAGRKLDLDAAFDEAYHERGFSTVAGGHIWRLRIESAAEKDQPHSGKKQGTDLTLPDSFAHWINELNLLQQQYDRAQDELKSLQQLLYSDWCKYMISAYHPDIEKGLPQMDDVRFFIENHSLPAVAEKKEQISDLQKQINTELVQIDKLIQQFNSGNALEVFHPDNNDPTNDSEARLIPFPKLIIEKKYSKRESGEIEKADSLDGIFIRKFDGVENREEIPLESENASFSGVSFWVNISSHQPLNDQREAYAKQLIKLIDTTTDTPDEFAIIDAEGISEYWQGAYINGQALDPYEILQWKDIPKDQWIHIYLKGAPSIKGPISIVLMNGLKGSLAGVRVFNAGLTAMELFCDMNMLLLKVMKLAPVKGPRYWQPNEPVVLIAGDMAEPSERYGFDEALPCLLLPRPGDFQFFDFPEGFSVGENGASYTNMLSRMKDLASDLNAATEGNDTFISDNGVSKPWHPLILEWKVGIAPLNDNAGTVGYEMPEDMITGNYILESDKPDLTPKPGHTPQYDPMKILSGSSLLTPHAKDRMRVVIERYLEKLHEDDPDWDNYGEGKPDPFQNPFVDEKGVADPEKFPIPQNVKPDDYISTALKAYNLIANGHFLSQSLGGFNMALQMLHQTFQLPIADPIGFSDDQEFAEVVKKAVERESKFAPLPLFEFDPLRTGKMKLLELSIIDSFGQIRQVYNDRLSEKPNLFFSRTMEEGHLPPRIAQPARINFRWLAAGHDEMEMNDHPVSSPVCGWLVPNNIDDSIMVYDQEGYELGAVYESENKDENHWKSTPGASHPVYLDQFPNKHLKKLVEQLMKMPMLSRFMDLLEKTHDQIDPENFAQHTDLAMLMGKPIAVVRASVGLEVKGNFAVNQDWNSFELAMNSALTSKEPRTTNKWEKIKFPIRIGEHGQLNDGVLGYWLDHRDTFYSTVPAGDGDINEFYFNAPHSIPFDANTPNITLSPADAPLSMTLLMDARGHAHGTCGLLPAKLISIPEDQYKPALKNMSATFFTRPLLMPQGKLAVPLPDEPGYSWSWLEQQDGRWKEISTIGIVHKETFVQAFKNGEDIWYELIKKGWIEETENNKARVAPQNHRKDPDPHPLLITQLHKIQQLLDAGHIVDEEYRPDFTSANRIKEGWLKLKPVE